MKTVEKDFVQKLSDLESKNISENNEYYINKIINIINNQNDYNINIINLQDFSQLLDELNYTSYNRGLLMMKIVLNNLKIIESKPYTKINLYKFQDIFLKRNISYEQFIYDVRDLIDYCLNNKNCVFDDYRYEILTMLRQEEKNRLEQIEVAKKIKNYWENLDIENLLKYFKSINLNERDLEGLKVYLNYLKEKKDNKSNDEISFDYQIKPTKLGYNKKEINLINNELNYILKKIAREHIKISYQEYLHYVKYVLILEPEKKACDADIDCLYDALSIDEQSYSFLKEKAKILLHTNKAIDIQDVLNDIDEINKIILNCKEKDKTIYHDLLNDFYIYLYHLSSHNHEYERALIK